MAAFKKGQNYHGPYSSDFEESKVQGLSRDAYNPGRTPNVYVENAAGRNRIQLDLSRVDSDESRALQRSWHRTAGFSAEVGRGTQHPKQSDVSSWPSVGADKPTPDQGSRGGFKWR